MPLYIRNLSRQAINERYLGSVAEKSLNFMHKNDAEISLVLIGKKRMRDLNRTYRGIDRVTDVLSFGNERGKGDKFISPRDNSENLGEIFICLERAKEQAREKGHSSKKEEAILLIHGILHLMGLDHEKDRDARIMERIEKKMIAGL